MAIEQINFIGPYAGRSKAIGALRFVNLYPEILQDGRIIALYGTPGLTAFCNLGAYPIRGLHPFGNVLYAASGNKLYEINTAGVATSLGTLDTSMGRVSFADNGTQIMLVDGTSGYIYNTSTDTFAKINDGDFPTADYVTFLDSFFIVNKADSGRFYISSSYDGTAWDALDFATAESTPDNLVLPYATYSHLYLIGEFSTEVWYNAGTAFPFQRADGMTSGYGCMARFSVAKADATGNSLFWLARTPQGAGVAVHAQGGNVVPISKHAQEYQWAQYSNIADATGYSYISEGHTFYVLNFPTANRTWVYDLTTNSWHERSSGLEGGRHLGEAYAYFNGDHLVGSYRDGIIYKLKNDVYADDGASIRRELVFPHLGTDGRRTFYHSLQIDMEEGVGIESGQGVDPQAMLQWSNDRGNFYGNEHWRSIGRMGEYGQRVKWNRLGAGFSRTFRLSITDPVKVAIKSATLWVS